MEKSFSSNAITDFTGHNLSELAQFGKVYLFDTVSSTQEIAKGLVSKREQALVIALVQTRGQGRFHRIWQSGPGGLYSSFLLFPDFSVKDKIAQLTLLFSLALAKSIEEMTEQKVTLRWPNDLILADKKVGGLLCERKGPGLIIGIGFNLNQTFFPDSLLDATSLFIETNREYGITQTLHTILTSLTNFYKEFDSNKFAQFLPEIKSRQVFLNQRVRVELWLRHIEGTVIDLDDNGQLLLRTDSGRLMTVTAGKVHRIRNV